MSSACYVYAIVRRDAPLPSDITSGGAELALVPWRDLAAVTGRMSGESAPITIEAMLHHETVVEAVRRQGPALPVRFGTVFRDTTLIVSALAERYEPLAANLDRLGDKVELSLTALWAAPLSGDARSQMPLADGTCAEQSAGSRYMRARADALRRDEAVKQQARTLAWKLDQVLGARALERRVSLVPAPRIALRVAYLLDPAHVSAFRTDFDAIRQRRRDVRLLLTGPWPPYSFVRGTETEWGVNN